MTLLEYINRNYGGSQAEFGRAMSELYGKHITRQQVYRWTQRDDIVVLRDKMYFEKYDIGGLKK